MRPAATAACGGGRRRRQRRSRAAGFNAATRASSTRPTRRAARSSSSTSRTPTRWDPQRRYYGLVLELRTGSTPASWSVLAEAGQGRPRARARPGHGPGRSPTAARPTPQAAGRHQVRGRLADHLQGHQVRHRARLRARTSLRRPDLPARRPGPGPEVPGPVQGQRPGQAGSEVGRDPGRQDHRLPPRRSRSGTSATCSPCPAGPGPAGQGHRRQVRQQAGLVRPVQVRSRTSPARALVAGPQHRSGTRHRPDPQGAAGQDRPELIVNANEIDNQLHRRRRTTSTPARPVCSRGAAKVLLERARRPTRTTPTTGFIRYFAITTKVEPFDNIHCRKAVHLRRRQDALQTARGGADAGGDIATNMLPPNIAGSDPTYDPYGTTRRASRRVDKAKEELKPCGKPNGFDTIIAVRNNRPAEAPAAEALQAALKNVGINADHRADDGALVPPASSARPSNVHKQGLRPDHVRGWGADFPTGYGFLRCWSTAGTSCRPATTTRRDQRPGDRQADRQGQRARPTRQGRRDLDADQPQGHGAARHYVPFVYDKASTAATRG